MQVHAETNSHQLTPTFTSFARRAGTTTLASGTVPRERTARAQGPVRPAPAAPQLGLWASSCPARLAPPVRDPAAAPRVCRRRVSGLSAQLRGAVETLVQRKKEKVKKEVTSRPCGPFPRTRPNSPAPVGFQIDPHFPAAALVLGRDACLSP